jgi:hypothetical protein
MIGLSSVDIFSGKKQVLFFPEDLEKNLFSSISRNKWTTTGNVLMPKKKLVFKSSQKIAFFRFFHLSCLFSWSLQMRRQTI